MLNPASPLPLKDPTLLRQANYLNGKWVEADSGKTIVVKNPATGEPIGEVPSMGTAETRRAIEAANRAFPAWRAMLAKERRVILRKLSDLKNLSPAQRVHVEMLQRTLHDGDSSFVTEEEI